MVQEGRGAKALHLLFASTTLAGAFGGLLASAIGKMNGIQGYLGWRWVFILEGILTCVVSFGIFFAIPDFPEDAKWLTEPEREYVRARLQEDQGKSALERTITFKDVVNCFKDYKIFLGGFMYFGLIVPGKTKSWLKVKKNFSGTNQIPRQQLTDMPTLHLPSSELTVILPFRPSYTRFPLGPLPLVSACSWLCFPIGRAIDFSSPSYLYVSP